MEYDEESIKKEHAEASERFWDRKSRFTYYLVSLPFALTGVAVSSFRVEDDLPVAIALIEVLSWFMMLVAGGTGLLARWAELNVARMESISASSMLHLRESQDRHDRFITRESYEISQKNCSKLIKVIRLEERAGVWMIRFLVLGTSLWILGRAVSVFVSFSPEVQ